MQANLLPHPTSSQHTGRKYPGAGKARRTRVTPFPVLNIQYVLGCTYITQLYAPSPEPTLAKGAHKYQ